MSTFFFAALFFLCGADQLFATRVHGANIRWGQALLALALLEALVRGNAAKGWGQGIARLTRSFLVPWGPFLAVYAIAALLAPQPAATLVKAAWALFNIGAVFALFQLRGRDPAMERGVRWGLTAIALVIWADAIMVYWFHWFQDTAYGFPSLPLTLHPFGWDLVVGYAQPDFSFLTDHKVRPNAFYYEPSYAGCALGFGLPLLFVGTRKEAGWKGLVSPALVMGAIVLTTSRSGILGALLTLGPSVLYGLVAKRVDSALPILKAAWMAVILLGIFLLSPFARDYLGTLIGIKGSDAVLRLEDPDTSEGGRIASALHCFHHWQEHPLLGNGVHQDPATGRLEAQCMDTWLEIAVESGLLGLLAFLYAVGSSVRRAFRDGARADMDRFLVRAALFVHFAINLNLTQTFPRLDYWFLFYFALSLLEGRRDGPR